MTKYLLSMFVGAAILPVVGCGEKASTPASNQATQAPALEEEHHHGSGPHDGTVTDWGGGVYHVEFTVDHDKKSTGVYILGSDGKSPQPIKADKVLLSINEPAFQVELKADPLPGEAAGTSSRFVGEHDNLGIVREFAGTITGEVDGTPYAGDFAEVAGEHGHEH
jgi:hypothetical protein